MRLSKLVHQHYNTTIEKRVFNELVGPAPELAFVKEVFIMTNTL